MVSIENIYKWLADTAILTFWLSWMDIMELSFSEATRVISIQPLIGLEMTWVKDEEVISLYVFSPIH